eukprot:7043733-Prymnesium_polylepis.2
MAQPSREVLDEQLVSAVDHARLCGWRMHPRRAPKAREHLILDEQTIQVTAWPASEVSQQEIVQALQRTRRLR